MTPESLRIKIPLDPEGFIALQCPRCKDSFQIRMSDLEQLEDPQIYCAQCGICNSKALFLLRQNVRKVAMQHAENLLADMVSNFTKKLQQSSRDSNGWRITGSKLPVKPVSKVRPTLGLTATELLCCETTIKLSFGNAVSIFYCPFCGQTQD